MGEKHTYHRMELEAISDPVMFGPEPMIELRSGMAESDQQPIPMVARFTLADATKFAETMLELVNRCRERSTSLKALRRR